MELLRRRARLHSSQLVMQNMDRMSIQRPAWPGLDYPMSGTRTQPRTLTFSTRVYQTACTGACYSAGGLYPRHRRRPGVHSRGGGREKAIGKASLLRAGLEGFQGLREACRVLTATSDYARSTSCRTTASARRSCWRRGRCDIPDLSTRSPNPLG